MTAEATDNPKLTRAWTLPYAARLGSSVRSQGLFLEIRSHLPKASQKALSVKGGELTLCMPAEASAAFVKAAALIGKALERIATRPVIPREIEDILGISTTDRRRWLADGRLPSLGPRTLRLRGRGEITFHVFDPAVVEDILNSGLVDTWRADDAEQAAEKRRRAAWKRQLTRSKAGAIASASELNDEDEAVKLRGWAEFAREGLLR